mmetsp:Transcript_44793/g.43390  ORF Transcript_44793/g.43390 Transcript_44793/m.43390 type:complete len:116 (+) Transcript_44793:653-1000(+)
MPASSESLLRKLTNPGPGHYQIPRNSSTYQISTNIPGGQGPFKSGSMKSCNFDQSKDVFNNPSPGQYEVETDPLLRKSYSTFNIKKLTSNFSLPTNCKRIKVNLYDPFQRVEQRV